MKIIQEIGNKGKGQEILIRIDGGFFVAGAILNELGVCRVAPIIRYMRGWDIERIDTYCKKKKWKYEIIGE